MPHMLSIETRKYSMEVNRFECQTVPASCLARRDLFIGLPILRLDVARGVL